MAKGKGSSFEREICRLLSDWYSGGTRDDLFWRSAGSGAMAKTRSKAGKATFGQYGDVQATDPIGQPLLDFFSIELKRGYSSFTFADLLDKKKKAALQTWEACLQQARTDHKNAKTFSWMLITRRDRREALVFIPIKAASYLKNEGGAKLHSIPNVRAFVKGKEGDNLRFYGAPLLDFLRVVNPHFIRKGKKG